MHPTLRFEYKNWKGEVGIRNVIPVKDRSFWYGHTKYHPESQWLLKAYDCDKGEYRDFAVRDIIRYL